MSITEALLSYNQIISLRIFTTCQYDSSAVSWLVQIVLDNYVVLIDIYNFMNIHTKEWWNVTSAFLSASRCKFAHTHIYMCVRVCVCVCV